MINKSEGRERVSGVRVGWKSLRGGGNSKYRSSKMNVHLAFWKKESNQASIAKVSGEKGQWVWGWGKVGVGSASLETPL